MDRLLRGEKQPEIKEEIKKIDELFKKVMIYLQISYCFQ